jgi:cysteine synthase
VKQILLLLLILFLVAGCECFLPGGKAPDGNIIHSGSETPETLVFEHSGAMDYFINELIRETMLHAPGMEVFVVADTQSLPAANQIIRKTGEFSGISAASTANGSLRLFSRRSGKVMWQMELFGTDGKSLWKRIVTLKK